MERKLTKVVDETEITVSERPKNKFSGSSDKNADKSHSLSYRKLCSCGTDVADNLCSPGCPDTHRSRDMSTKGGYVENLNFREGIVGKLPVNGQGFQRFRQ